MFKAPVYFRPMLSTCKAVEPWGTDNLVLASTFGLFVWSTLLETIRVTLISC